MSMPFLKAVFRSDASHCGVGLAGVFRTISEIWVDGVPGGKFGIGGSQ